MFLQFKIYGTKRLLRDTKESKFLKTNLTHLQYTSNHLFNTHGLLNLSRASSIINNWYLLLGPTNNRDLLFLTINWWYGPMNNQRFPLWISNYTIMVLLWYLEIRVKTNLAITASLWYFFIKTIIVYILYKK